ncbi:hypothetical protein PoB_002948500, partial [Plakobranchus ocellatus]
MPIFPQNRIFFSQLISGEVIGDGELEHWLLISLMEDIGDGGLEHWLFISPVENIGYGKLEHWLLISVVGGYWRWRTGAVPETTRSSTQ